MYCLTKQFLWLIETSKLRNNWYKNVFTTFLVVTELNL